MGALWAVAGAIILGAGTLISRVQTLLHLQHQRRLTNAERSLLQRVFRTSLALADIRLIEGRAGLFSLLGSRPFALGNTIFLKKRDVATEPELLVHECAHAWQYQHVGARYAAQALVAQYRLSNANDWRADIARGNETWAEFNRESQAQFLQDLYVQGTLNINGGTPVKGGGLFYDADGGGGSAALPSMAATTTTAPTRSSKRCGASTRALPR